MSDKLYYNRLCQKFLKGSISDVEKKELARWLNEDNAEGLVIPKNFASNKAFHKKQILQKIEDAIASGDIQEAKHEVASRAFKSFLRRNITRTSIGWMAAASVVVVFLFYQFKFTEGIEKKNSNEIVAAWNPNALKDSIILPDGTQIILKGTSKVIYDSSFNKNNRYVTLEGEAFFNVTHDRDHPFIIHTTKADIKVLGTQFNLRDYVSEQKVEAALIEGSIEIQAHNQPNKKILLKPMHKAVIEDNDKLESASVQLHIQPIKYEEGLIAETSWLNDKLVFHNTRLEEIGFELERRFDISITFSSDKTKDYRYTGTFDDSNLNEILKILSRLKPIKYQYKNDALIFE